MPHQHHPAIIKRLKQIDPHLRSALAHSRSGNVKVTRLHLTAVGKLSAPLNGQLDAAGLLDCGSNQQ